MRLWMLTTAILLATATQGCVHQTTELDYFGPESSRLSNNTKCLDPSYVVSLPDWLAEAWRFTNEPSLYRISQSAAPGEQTVRVTRINGDNTWEVARLEKGLNDEVRVVAARGPYWDEWIEGAQGDFINLGPNPFTGADISKTLTEEESRSLSELFDGRAIARFEEECARDASAETLVMKHDGGFTIIEFAMAGTYRIYRSALSGDEVDYAGLGALAFVPRN